MDEDRDFIVLEDDDGNTIELDVVDYITYDGLEYALLIDSSEACDCEECEDEECAHEHADGEECDCEGPALYVMQVIVHEDTDTEEFIPVEDEDLMEKLVKIMQTRYDEEWDEEEVEDEDD